MSTGAIEIRGPMTKEEKVRWDHAREILADHNELIEAFEEMTEKRPKDKRLRKALERHRKIGARLVESVSHYAARLDEEERKREAFSSD